ncbi:Zinc finger NHR/GATA-type protein [Dioscorea alata]|uniref:Zinc finger NHR/GATA-type protein n=5 Tax=Dioscorea alata TaxID=55571 RepID=A0ACB7V5A7_DIOAL|nr:Zinc finger NHR/GATA-type protein [Dioscorea alata]KAH7668604.1 Zinc finger NHR/GATA-type protein [Dioscorea alata]
MGKQGPCHHCGATSTPLWRNGPPEKPVLCNACGSRWRTKGTLTNYFPFQAREHKNLEGTKVPEAPKLKIISSKIKEQRIHRRMQENVTEEIEHETPYCGQNFQKLFDEDVSNRSSSGSAISFSEGCAYFAASDVNDLTASQQSVVWEPVVPSRKRACIPRPKPSSVEKLRRDLYSIMCEQQSSNISEITDSDLLYENENLSASAEIGHGGVLIRLPNSEVVEEESEASSFPINDKLYNENKVHTSDISECEKLYVLQGRDSPLSRIDLKDIISFEAFSSLFSDEEQQQLIKFLPSTDTAKTQTSLKSMFFSPQFLEDLHCFQQLLLKGIFDLSLSGVDAKECNNLKNLVLYNTEKARWVEQYEQLKDVKHQKNI